MQYNMGRWAHYLGLVTRPSPHPHAECGGVWRQALIMTDEELDGARWRWGDTAQHQRTSPTVSTISEAEHLHGQVEMLTINK